jgi:hypothetical protein
MHMYTQIVTEASELAILVKSTSWLLIINETKSLIVEVESSTFLILKHAVQHDHKPVSSSSDHHKLFIILKFSPSLSSSPKEPFFKGLPHRLLSSTLLGAEIFCEYCIFVQTYVLLLETTLYYQTKQMNAYQGYCSL